MNNLIELGRETFEFAYGDGSYRDRLNNYAEAGAGALAGAGAAVGGSALIAKRRRAEKDRIKKGLGQRKPRKPRVGQKEVLKRNTRPPQSANTKARAEMRKKYGKNWYQPGGSKKKLLGYGALAGAALGGAAGHYARKKKGDS